jgi:hypothetical protein
MNETDNRPGNGRFGLHDSPATVAAPDLPSILRNNCRLRRPVLAHGVPGADSIGAFVRNFEQQHG